MLNLRIKLQELEKENSEDELGNEEELIEDSKYDNKENELNKNIHFEIKNIKSLLEDFESKFVTKQNYLNNLESQIDRIENNNDELFIARENEDLKEELKKT